MWFLIITFFILLSQHSFTFVNDSNIALIKAFDNLHKYKGSDAVIIYDSSFVDVKESGLSYVTAHKLILIITEIGAKNHRSIQFGYDPLSADISIIFARIYRKNGKIEIIDTSKVMDYPAAARMIYWGGREKLLEFGRLEPGDAIEFITHRKGFTYALLYDESDDRFIPPMRGHFYDIVEFWSSLPVIEKVYQVAMPEDKPLQYEIYNGELHSFIHFAPETTKSVNVVINPHALKIENTKNNSSITNEKIANNQSNDNSISNNPTPSNEKISQLQQRKTLYCWSKRDIAPFRGEPNMVATSDVATKLLVSTSPDWYAKAVWFHNVNEDYGSFEVTPEVKALVDSLLKGINDELEKISILTHWAAEEIRYSGISIGEGEGYTLHKGGMTFADRCGVCKDKAGMLVTMLRSAGFQSYPAMTMAGSRIDRIPADQFNHSVTVAKLSSGDWILLDPTWVPGVRELWSSAEQQQQYLLGIPGGADLMTAPVSPPENHYLKLIGDSKLLADGTLEGELILTAEGQSDATIRRAFIRNFKTSWEDYFERLFSEYSPESQITSIKFTDPYNINQPFQSVIKYKIPKFARLSKNKYLFTPLLASNLFEDDFISGELHIDTNLTERKYGFRIRCSKQVEIEETIKLPSDKAEYIPEFNSVVNDAAEFTANYTISSNTIKLRAFHKMNKRVYEPEQWHSFKSALTERMKLMSEQIVLIKN